MARHRGLLSGLAVTLMLGLAFLGLELHDFATMLPVTGRDDGSGANLRTACAGEDQPAAAWAVLAFPRYYLDRDLLGRLSAAAEPITAPRAASCQDKRGEIRTYAIGYMLAFALTVAAFAFVHWLGFPARTTPGVVLGLGVVQMLAHFRCFLHIGLRRSARDDLGRLFRGPVFAARCAYLLAGRFPDARHHPVDDAGPEARGSKKAREWKNAAGAWIVAGRDAALVFPVAPLRWPPSQGNRAREASRCVRRDMNNDAAVSG